MTVRVTGVGGQWAEGRLGDGTGVEDTDLVTRARHGDREAFESLVSANAAAAKRAALQFGAGDDADDVVQEAFVKAYRRLSEYRGDAPFRSWLVAIVANETRNLHRSRRRRDAAGQRAALHAVTTEADDPVSGTLAAEDRHDLVAAVRDLDEGDREVIAYRYLLDRSEAETADLLDWPRGTVKSRTARALAKLRTRLGAAVAVLVVAGLIVAVPPARRAAADVISTVLRFAGVEVHRDSAPPPVGLTPSPLPSGRQDTLEGARASARFPIGVPAALGQPEQVLLADIGPDGAPRVVSLVYRAGSVRVDEFDGEFDLAFTKQTQNLEWTSVGNAPAMWIPLPHTLTYVDREGVTRTATTRLSGPVLLWSRGMVSYRIEGLATMAEALSVAASVG
ncbi:MAG TPA: RNA polymerase sigma factor [Micromonosporaceae bacterium]|nr:RNA polymerase sigma factor [Micromonosporaceae bacterium]